MKKVLLITYRFPPSGGTGVLRNTKYVKYLPSFHWQPTVLCIKPSHFSIQDEGLMADIPKTVAIHQTNCLKIKQKNLSWSQLDLRNTSNSDKIKR